MKEWIVVHWKYNLLVHNNLGLRAAVQGTEVQDSFPASSTRDFKPISSTLQKEALPCTRIYSMLANNFETILFYQREY